ncbi:unnamed protein product [Diamesa serratosioi]
MVLSKTIVTVILLLCTGNVLSQVVNPCAGMTSGFVNDFSGCRNYFSCVNSVAFPLECPLGLYFQSTTSKCDLIENVECSRCPATGTTATRNSNSCTAYTLCINGVAIDRECAAGLWFDIPTSRCDLIANVECEGINNCPETGTAIVPDITDCTKFLVCADGEVLETRECADDLFFNPNTLKCVIADVCPPKI